MAFWLESAGKVFYIRQSSAAGRASRRAWGVNKAAAIIQGHLWDGSALKSLYDNIPRGFDPVIYLLLNIDVIRRRVNSFEYYSVYGLREERQYRSEICRWRWIWAPLADLAKTDYDKNLRLFESWLIQILAMQSLIGPQNINVTIEECPYQFSWLQADWDEVVYGEHTDLENFTSDQLLHQWLCHGLQEGQRASTIANRQSLHTLIARSV